MAKEINTGKIINIGLLIVGFVVVKKTLETLGIIKTAKETEQEGKAEQLDKGSTADQTIVSIENPELSFTPNYWATINNKVLIPKLIPNYKTLSKDQLVQKMKDLRIIPLYIGDPTVYLKYADDIYNSYKVWYLPDTEEKVFAILRLLKSQQQISYLTYRFYERYKQDLLSYFKLFMNTEQLATVQDLIKNKPLYAKR